MTAARRLAADLGGYSRLMGEGETGTFVCAVSKRISLN